MSRGPHAFDRSSLVGPALLTVLLGLVFLWQPAGAYILPRHGAISAQQQNIDAMDFATAAYSNRHTRSRSRATGRSDRLGNPQLYVNMTSIPAVAHLNENVIIECEATGPHPAMIFWLKNGQKIIQDDSEGVNAAALDDADIIKLSDLSMTAVKSRLFIDCVTPNDEAEYTCVAISREHSNSASYKLQVSPSSSSNKSPACHSKAQVAKAPRIIFWTNNKLVPVTSSVVLVCRALGSNPVITWLFGSETRITDSDRFYVREDGDLEIKNLQWSDMGSYTCQVENEVGIDRQVTFIYPYLV